MSVSMLLNAADVVTAAERCHAIDEKTGRIPINFLLSRSNDLDDHVKHQLQQLAAQSSSISIHPDALPSNHDAVMTDVHPQSHPQLHPHPQLQLQPQLQPQPQPQPQPHSQHLHPDHPHPDHPHFNPHHQQEQPHMHHLHPQHHFPHHHFMSDSLTSRHNESLRSLHSPSTNDDEEEALNDIYRETHREPHRADRRMIRRALKKNDQTLTRKAIRKHAGGQKGPRDLSLLPKDSSSTINTVSGSSCIKSSSQGSQTNNTPRRRWKLSEDQLLVQIVAEHGPTRWNNLASHFPGRNGRQVRLRWMNHLQPSLDKRPWRPEEDAVLLEAHKALGNKWAMISVRLGGRTDNSVKNRYKSIVRRSAREAKARKQRSE